MLIKTFYHTKYNTKKLNIIYKTVKNYNSKIYNKKKIYNLIKKKENIIKNYITIHQELEKLKIKFYFKYLNDNKKEIIYKKIIKCFNKIIELENYLKFLDKEENILFDVYKIKSNKLQYFIYKYFY